MGRNRAAQAAAFLLLLVAASGSVRAETQLTDFGGMWHGTGRDRASPLQRMQVTRCINSVVADLRQMAAKMKCEGDAGLIKLIELRIRLAGKVFSGTIVQRMRDGNPSETVLSGSVSGRKTDSTADFVARFPGLVPDVNVSLKSTSRSAYTMLASTFGGALMDVTFRKATKQ
jgi:hypothetical protein